MTVPRASCGDLSTDPCGSVPMHKTIQTRKDTNDTCQYVGKLLLDRVYGHMNVHVCVCVCAYLSNLSGETYAGTRQIQCGREDSSRLDGTQLCFIALHRSLYSSCIEIGISHLAEFHHEDEMVHIKLLVFRNRPTQVPSQQHGRGVLIDNQLQQDEPKCLMLLLLWWLW